MKIHNEKCSYLGMWFCLIFLTFVVLISGCTKEKEPIKLGVATSLTGAVSTWGVNVRNGVMLAVEQVNKAGGINGRSIELLVRDDKMDPEEALKVDRELIEKGVVAIIGHYLSTVSVKVVPLLNEKKVLMVSPGSSTADLTGLDDHFFRLMLPNDIQAPLAADYLYNKYNIKNIAVVYDLANPKFTESFFRHFKKAIERLGGNVSNAIGTDSRQNYSAPDIAKEIIQSQVEGLLLITNGIQSAMICHHLRKGGFKGMIMDSGWSLDSNDFLSNGGSSIDGVIAVNAFSWEANNESFIRFKNEYESRFGSQISEASRNGYDAAQILLSALSKPDDPKKLKETILKQKVFKGLDGDIVFDDYGDPLRTLYIQEIQSGKVRVIGKIEVDDLLE